MIHIFKAKDGRWTYCPDTVRNWPSFNLEGEFDSQQQAIEALKRDRTCYGVPVKVESGFFSRVLVVAALVILPWSPPSEAAEPWDRADAALGAVAVTVTAIDWAQTRYIARNPCPHAGGGTDCTDPYREAGFARHFIGARPTAGQVDAYFATVILVGGMVAHYLPSAYRKPFLGFVTLIELGVTMQNKRIGIKMEF